MKYTHIDSIRKRTTIHPPKYRYSHIWLNCNYRYAYEAEMHLGLQMCTHPAILIRSVIAHTHRLDRFGHSPHYASRLSWHNHNTHTSRVATTGKHLNDKHSCHTSSLAHNSHTFDSIDLDIVRTTHLVNVYGSITLKHAELQLYR